MQQRFRRLALFIGAASLACGGLIVVACGTDNGGSTPTPQQDGAKPDGGGKTDGPTGNETSIPDAEAPDCAAEAVLRSNTATSGIFCAFYRRDAAAPEAGVGQSYCENDETCCNPGKKGTAFPPSYCADGKGANACAADPNNAPSWTPDAGTSWECADKNSCGAGQICCFFQDQARLALDPTDKLNPGGFGNNNPAHPPACNGKAMYNVGGTRCVTGTACAAAEYRVCSLTDSCGAGTTCQAVEAQFRDLGYCK